MNTKKLNGSFNITVNGMPYNTIEGDKYFEETKKLYETNPELFEIEKELEVKELNYKEKRQAEYPSIQEQLDMIYWDKVNGTTIWQDTITAIKNKYNKDKY